MVGRNDKKIMRLQDMHGCQEENDGGMGHRMNAFVSL